MSTPIIELPLHRKIEKAITFYLQLRQKAGLLRGITISEGHTAEEPKIPWLSVYCSNPRPADDMPPETRIKQAELVLHLKTHADDEALEDADRRLEEIDAIFADVGKIIAWLDKPVTGADDRPVQELHVYAIHEGEQPDTNEQNNWHNQRVFEVVAQGWDPES